MLKLKMYKMKYNLQKKSLSLNDEIQPLLSKKNLKEKVVKKDI